MVMFTRETPGPTTPSHQQASGEDLTCLSLDRVESVTIDVVRARRVLGSRR
jgi:hypothetical protein